MNSMPQASDINRGLVDGSDPLDFIRQNLNRQQPQPLPIQQPDQIVTQVVKEVEQSFKDKDIGLDLPYNTQPSIPKPDAITPKPDASTQEPPIPEEAKGPEESIKHLRKKTVELSRTLEEKEATAAELAETLEKYKTGEALPDIVETYKQRINELEHYEQLHNLRMSKNYASKYVAPIEELKTKAVEVANSYGVDPTVLDKAFALENKKDLNAFLRTHFDDVGALEVRSLLDSIKSIQKEAVEAEAVPQQTLQELREEQRKHEVVQEKQRVDRISSNAKSGWVDALTELRAEGKYPELELTGTPENDRLVTSVLNEAAAEYGKLVKELGLNGTKELRPEAAKILAKRYLLSQAAAIAMESRAQHHQRAEDIINTTRREATFTRPPIGGGVSSTSNEQTSRAKSPEDAAEMLLRKVGFK